MQVVSLLGTLGRSVKEAREMGRKFGVVEAARGAKSKGAFGVMGMGMGMEWGGEGEEGMSEGDGGRAVF